MHLVPFLHRTHTHTHTSCCTCSDKYIRLGKTVDLDESTNMYTHKPEAAMTASYRNLVFMSATPRNQDNTFVTMYSLP